MKPLKPICLYVIVVVLLSIVVTGCQHTQTTRATPPALCTLPTTMNFETAIAESKADLENTACHIRFEAYFQNLLKIAKGSPEMKNRTLFSKFLIWANEQGIITRNQSKKYYNSYFNTTFMSLPNEYNICSSCSKKEVLTREMQKELVLKEEGLLKACGDKQTYYAACKQFNSTLMVLDAVCAACLND